MVLTRFGGFFIANRFMAAMIEGQVRAEAKERQVASLMKGDVNPRSGQLAGTGKQTEFTRESRQQIAEAVGMAATTHQITIAIG